MIEKYTQYRVVKYKYGMIDLQFNNPQQTSEWFSWKKFNSEDKEVALDYLKKELGQICPDDIFEIDVLNFGKPNLDIKWREK